MQTRRVAAHLHRVHSAEEVVVEHRVQYCRHHRTRRTAQTLPDRTARQRRRSLERGFDPIKAHCKSVQLPEDTHFCVVSTSSYVHHTTPATQEHTDTSDSPPRTPDGAPTDEETRTDTHAGATLPHGRMHTFPQNTADTHTPRTNTGRAC